MATAYAQMADTAKQKSHLRMLQWYDPEKRPWHEIQDDGYLYANLAYHLVGAGRQGELVDLLANSPEWMRVKSANSEGRRSYLNDLELAIGLYSDPLSASDLLVLIQLHVAKQDAKGKSYTRIPTRIWCSLAQTAFQAGQSAIATNLFEKAFESALSDQRELSNSAFDLPFDVLICAQIEIGHLTEAQETIRRLRGMGVEIESKTWSLIAAALSKAYRFDEAVETINLIKENSTRASGFMDLAEALSRAGRFTEADAAFDHAQTIIDGISAEEPLEFLVREYVRHHLASSLATAGLLERARKVANAIEDPDEHAEMLAALACALAKTGEERSADRAFTEAQAAIDVMKHEANRASASAVLAFQLARAGRIADAWRTAQTIPGAMQVGVLVTMSEIFMDAGLRSEADAAFKEAYSAYQSLPECTRKSTLSRRISGILAGQYRFAEALNILSIDVLDDYVQALAHWGDHFERFEAGLSMTILREITRVTGWRHLSWQEVHELLG